MSQILMPVRILTVCLLFCISPLLTHGADCVTDAYSSSCTCNPNTSGTEWCATDGTSRCVVTPADGSNPAHSDCTQQCSLAGPNSACTCFGRTIESGKIACGTDQYCQEHTCVSQCIGSNWDLGGQYCHCYDAGSVSALGRQCKSDGVCEGQICVRVCQVGSFSTTCTCRTATDEAIFSKEGDVITGVCYAEQDVDVCQTTQIDGCTCTLAADYTKCNSAVERRCLSEACTDVCNSESTFSATCTCHDATENRFCTQDNYCSHDQCVPQCTANYVATMSGYCACYGVPDVSMTCYKPGGAAADQRTECVAAICTLICETTYTTTCSCVGADNNAKCSDGEDYCWEGSCKPACSADSVVTDCECELSESPLEAPCATNAYCSTNQYETGKVCMPVCDDTLNPDPEWCYCDYTTDQGASCPLVESGDANYCEFTVDSESKYDTGDYQLCLPQCGPEVGVPCACNGADDGYSCQDVNNFAAGAVYSCRDNQCLRMCLTNQYYDYNSNGIRSVLDWTDPAGVGVDWDERLCSCTRVDRGAYCDTDMYCDYGVCRPACHDDVELEQDYTCTCVTSSNSVPCYNFDADVFNDPNAEPWYCYDLSCTGRCDGANWHPDLAVEDQFWEVLTPGLAGCDHWGWYSGLGYHSYECYSSWLGFYPRTCHCVDASDDSSACYFGLLPDYWNEQWTVIPTHSCDSGECVIMCGVVDYVANHEIEGNYQFHNSNEGWYYDWEWDYSCSCKGVDNDVRAQDAYHPIADEQYPRYCLNDVHVFSCWHNDYIGSCTCFESSEGAWCGPLGSSRCVYETENDDNTPLICRPVCDTYSYRSNYGEVGCTCYSADENMACYVDTDVEYYNPKRCLNNYCVNSCDDSVEAKNEWNCVNEFCPLNLCHCQISEFAQDELGNTFLADSWLNDDMCITDNDESSSYNQQAFCVQGMCRYDACSGDWTDQPGDFERNFPCACVFGRDQNNDHLPAAGEVCDDQDGVVFRCQVHDVEAREHNLCLPVCPDRHEYYDTCTCWGADGWATYQTTENQRCWNQQSIPVCGNWNHLPPLDWWDDFTNLPAWMTNNGYGLPYQCHCYGAQHGTPCFEDATCVDDGEAGPRCVPTCDSRGWGYSIPDWWEYADGNIRGDECTCALAPDYTPASHPEDDEYYCEREQKLVVCGYSESYPESDCTCFQADEGAPCYFYRSPTLPTAGHPIRKAACELTGEVWTSVDGSQTWNKMACTFVCSATTTTTFDSLLNTYGACTCRDATENTICSRVNGIHRCVNDECVPDCATAPVGDNCHCDTYLTWNPPGQVRRCLPNEDTSFVCDEDRHCRYACNIPEIPGMILPLSTPCTCKIAPDGSQCTWANDATGIRSTCENGHCSYTCKTANTQAESLLCNCKGGSDEWSACTIGGVSGKCYKQYCFPACSASSNPWLMSPPPNGIPDSADPAIGRDSSFCHCRGVSVSNARCGTQKVCQNNECKPICSTEVELSGCSCNLAQNSAKYSSAPLRYCWNTQPVPVCSAASVSGLDACTCFSAVDGSVCGPANLFCESQVCKPKCSTTFVGPCTCINADENAMCDQSGTLRCGRNKCLPKCTGNEATQSIECHCFGVSQELKCHQGPETDDLRCKAQHCGDVCQDSQAFSGACACTSAQNNMFCGTTSKCDTGMCFPACGPTFTAPCTCYGTSDNMKCDNARGACKSPSANTKFCQPVCSEFSYKIDGSWTVVDPCHCDGATLTATNGFLCKVNALFACESRSCKRMCTVGSLSDSSCTCQGPNTKNAIAPNGLFCLDNQPVPACSNVLASSVCTCFSADVSAGAVSYCLSGVCEVSNGINICLPVCEIMSSGMPVSCSCRTAPEHATCEYSNQQYKYCRNGGCLSLCAGNEVGEFSCSCKGRPDELKCSNSPLINRAEYCVASRCVSVCTTTYTATCSCVSAMDGSKCGASSRCSDGKCKPICDASTVLQDTSVCSCFDANPSAPSPQGWVSCCREYGTKTPLSAACNSFDTFATTPMYKLACKVAFAADQTATACCEEQLAALANPSVQLANSIASDNSFKCCVAHFGNQHGRQCCGLHQVGTSATDCCIATKDVVSSFAQECCLLHSDLNSVDFQCCVDWGNQPDTNDQRCCLLSDAQQATRCECVYPGDDDADLLRRSCCQNHGMGTTPETCCVDPLNDVCFQTCNMYVSKTRCTVFSDHCFWDDVGQTCISHTCTERLGISSCLTTAKNQLQQCTWGNAERCIPVQCSSRPNSVCGDVADCYLGTINDQSACVPAACNTRAGANECAAGGAKPCLFVSSTCIHQTCADRISVSECARTSTDCYYSLQSRCEISCNLRDWLTSGQDVDVVVADGQTFTLSVHSSFDCWTSSSPNFQVITYQWTDPAGNPILQATSDSYLASTNGLERGKDHTFHVLATPSATTPQFTFVSKTVSITVHVKPPVLSVKDTGKTVVSFPQFAPISLPVDVTDTIQYLIVRWTCMITSSQNPCPADITDAIAQSSFPSSASLEILPPTTGFTPGDYTFVVVVERQDIYGSGMVDSGSVKFSVTILKVDARQGIEVFPYLTLSYQPTITQVSFTPVLAFQDATGRAVLSPTAAQFTPTSYSWAVTGFSSDTGISSFPNGINKETFIVSAPFLDNLRQLNDGKPFNIEVTLALAYTTASKPGQVLARLTIPIPGLFAGSCSVAVIDKDLGPFDTAYHVASFDWKEIATMSDVSQQGLQFALYQQSASTWVAVGAPESGETEVILPDSVAILGPFGADVAFQYRATNLFGVQGVAECFVKVPGKSYPITVEDTLLPMLQSQGAGDLTQVALNTARLLSVIDAIQPSKDLQFYVEKMQGSLLDSLSNTNSIISSDFASTILTSVQSMAELSDDGEFALKSLSTLLEKAAPLVPVPPSIAALISFAIHGNSAGRRDDTVQAPADIVTSVLDSLVLNVAPSLTVGIPIVIEDSLISVAIQSTFVIPRRTTGWTWVTPKVTLAIPSSVFQDIPATPTSKAILRVSQLGPNTRTVNGLANLTWGPSTRLDIGNVFDFHLQAESGPIKTFRERVLFSIGDVSVDINEDKLVNGVVSTLEYDASGNVLGEEFVDTWPKFQSSGASRSKNDGVTTAVSTRTIRRRNCRFYDTAAAAWNSSGVRWESLKVVTNPNTTAKTAVYSCSTNHFTSFVAIATIQVQVVLVDNRTVLSPMEKVDSPPSKSMTSTNVFIGVFVMVLVVLLVLVAVWAGCVRQKQQKSKESEFA